MLNFIEFQEKIKKEFLRVLPEMEITFQTVRKIMEWIYTQLPLKRNTPMLHLQFTLMGISWNIRMGWS